MALEPGKGLLALELRDMTEASVSFSLLNLHTNAMVFDRYVFEEEWWMSLVAIKGNTLLIKQYHDSQQPEKQGLMAVDIENMEVVWWLENFQLIENDETTILGKEHGEEESFLKRVEIISGKEIALNPKAKVVEQVGSHVLYPLHYDLESPHFETVKSFIVSHFNIKAVGACDYLEVEDLIIISWFYSEGNTLANVISVIDSDGKIVVEEKLGTGLDAYASDTFFVLKNRLIFVVNKTQLVVYELFGIV